MMVIFTWLSNIELVLKKLKIKPMIYENICKLINNKQYYTWKYYC